MLVEQLQPEASGAATLFSDQRAIGSWAEQAIAQAVEMKGGVGYEDGLHGKGIINGRGDNRFEPLTAMTRAEMVVLLLRIQDRLL